MVSRRTFVAGAALAVAAPALAAQPAIARPFAGAAAAAPRTLPLDLTNRRTGQQSYAHVMGLDRATGMWFFLFTNGKSRVFPGSPTSTMTPIANTAIPLGGAGTRKRVTLPAMDSGRVYFSVGKPLTFFVNPGGGIVVPSVANPADANAQLEWGFFELSLDGNGVFANLTFVDFVALRIGLALSTATGRKDVGGLGPNGLSRIITGLRAQASADDPGWNDLIVTRGGKGIRVLSPNTAANSAAWTGRLDGYLNPYIHQVWQKYRTTDLHINTQSALGTVVGRVGADGQLRFPGIGSFGIPSSYAVFNCSVPPFVTTNDAMGNLTARLAAALNRGTLLANAHQPDPTSAQFYRAPVTNHYARLVHGNTSGRHGYAFPYDDVRTAAYDTEGSVVDAHRTLLTVGVG